MAITLSLVSDERSPMQQVRNAPRRRLQPAARFLICFAGASFLFAIVVAAYYSEWAAVAVIAAFSSLPLLTYFFDMTYRLSADAERIYYRDWGFRSQEIAVDFTEIQAIETAFRGNGVFKSRFMPFEIIILHTDNQEAGDIWIYPPAFVDSDIKDFLTHLHGRMPGVFPENVVEYMRSGRPL